MDETDGRPILVPLSDAVRIWAMVGWLSFGGPAGQIALLHREVVEKRRWVSEDRFLHALSFCTLLPGPEAQQLATYLGWLLHRTPGGLIAGGLFVLPSVAILLGLSLLYVHAGQSPWLLHALGGVKPVVVAVVLGAGWTLGRRVARRPVPLALAALAFGALSLGVPFPAVVLGAGLIGWAVNRTSAPKPVAAAARPSLRRTLRLGAVGLVGWAVSFVGLALGFGLRGLPTLLYGFFTRAALVTFGGAYAVLAYVNQAAVSAGWLTVGQTLDGLAFAETTPGPLVMTLQFVGFMAGWNHPGALSPTASACVCAAVTTAATFGPSFLLVLIGAPYVERLRGNPTLTAALGGVSAAVVGVILHLGATFGLAVLLPGGRPEWVAMGLAVAALVGLIRFKLPVVALVALGAGLGLLLGFSGSA